MSCAKQCRWQGSAAVDKVRATLFRQPTLAALQKQGDSGCPKSWKAAQLCMLAVWPQCMREGLLACNKVKAVRMRTCALATTKARCSLAGLLLEAVKLDVGDGPSPARGTCADQHYKIAKCTTLAQTTTLAQSPKKLAAVCSSTLASIPVLYAAPSKITVTQSSSMCSACIAVYLQYKRTLTPSSGWRCRPGSAGRPCPGTTASAGSPRSPEAPGGWAATADQSARCPLASSPVPATEEA